MKSVLRELIRESSFRLKQDLLTCDMKLTLQQDAHVPDTLTRIRVLPGVAVVGQQEKVFRSEIGKDSLIVYVKFLPKTSEIYRNVKNMANMIKKLPGIEIVTVLKLGGRPIMYKGKPIIS